MTRTPGGRGGGAPGGYDSDTGRRRAALRLAHGVSSEIKINDLGGEVLMSVQIVEPLHNKLNEQFVLLELKLIRPIPAYTLTAGPASGESVPPVARDRGDEWP